MTRGYVLVVIVVCFQAARPQDLPSSGGPISTNLKLVATVDGKSYFADVVERRSWLDAGKYCNSLDMRLASITTQSQADALQQAHDSTDFMGSFWTSGRDAHLIRQFSWNNTGEALQGYVAFPGRTDYEYQTCVYYYIYSKTISELRFYRCTFDQFFTLCET